MISLTSRRLFSTLPAKSLSACSCRVRSIGTVSSTTTTERMRSGVSRDGTETIETYVSAEIHKVNIVRQKEVSGEDGILKKVTIPPNTWDEDHASASEAIIKAERENPSIQEMQASTVNSIKHKGTSADQKRA